MTPREFAAIEARANAATPGPWSSYPGRITPALAHIAIPNSMHPTARPVDAEFVAHAREDIPALLRAVRERDNTIDRVRELHSRKADCGSTDCDDCPAFCTECCESYPCDTIAALGTQERL